MFVRVSFNFIGRHRGRRCNKQQILPPQIKFLISVTSPVPRWAWPGASLGPGRGELERASSFRKLCSRFQLSPLPTLSVPRAGQFNWTPSDLIRSAGAGPIEWQRKRRVPWPEVAPKACMGGRRPVLPVSGGATQLDGSEPRNWRRHFDSQQQTFTLWLGFLMPGACIKFRVATIFKVIDRPDKLGKLSLI